jgi:hypothetical protein
LDPENVKLLRGVHLALQIREDASPEKTRELARLLNSCAAGIIVSKS